MKILVVVKYCLIKFYIFMKIIFVKVYSIYYLILIKVGNFFILINDCKFSIVFWVFCVYIIFKVDKLLNCVKI